MAKTREQAEAERKHKEELRARLRKLVDNLRVPASVLAGDVYKVRAWKEVVNDANAILKRSNATAASLDAARLHLEMYK